MSTRPRTVQEIALNAIRWRVEQDNDSPSMRSGDRRWLLGYIDQHEVGAVVTADRQEEPATEAGATRRMHPHEALAVAMDAERPGYSMPNTDHDWEMWGSRVELHLHSMRFRVAAIEREAQGEQPAPLDVKRSYTGWVKRVAEALHEDCQLEWQAIAVVDPTRQITMHEADTHWGRGHDLVRRLALFNQPSTEPAQGGTG